MLAMAMVAMLAVSLFAAMRVSFRAQRSAEAAVAPVRSADLAMEFIAADLQNIRPASASDYLLGSDGRDARGHDGDSILCFTTAEAKEQPAANGEVKRVELAHVTAADGQSLLVRRVIRNLFTDLLPPAEEEILCRGVFGLNLRYYDGSDWQNTWDSAQLADTLPRAIEVTLQLEVKDAEPFTAVRVINLASHVEAVDPLGGGL